MGGKSLLEVLAADSAKSKNFRFGRDYYIKNAAKSAGARSPSKVLAESEVSLKKELDNLEGNCLHHSLSRRLYSPRNSSRNFVKNPLLYFDDSCENE